MRDEGRLDGFNTEGQGIYCNEWMNVIVGVAPARHGVYIYILTSMGDKLCKVGCLIIL